MKNFWEISNMKKLKIVCIALLFNWYCVNAQQPGNNAVITGAERMQVYLPMLKGKTVAVFANQTSMVKNTHLVDTLLSSGITVVKIFEIGRAHV